MNEKNFVGLIVNSEYVVCGSELNEVFVYYKVLVGFLNLFYVFVCLIFLILFINLVI